jgi:hypothetical protein
LVLPFLAWVVVSSALELLDQEPPRNDFVLSVTTSSEDVDLAQR